jgi:hypothetical protein
MRVPMDPYLLLIFAAAAGAIAWTALQALIGKVRTRINARRVTIGRNLTDTWAGKVLREPATGQVSLCVATALRTESPWQRWVRAQPVLLLTHNREVAARFRCPCMMCVMSRGFVTKVGMDSGRIRTVPAKQCAIAPATEAAAFLASIPTAEEEA